jgi:hypothetical protein
MERRGIETEVGERLREEQRREMQARLERAAELGRLEREAKEATRSTLDVSADIAAAARARDELVREKAAERARAVAREAWERRQAAREKQLEGSRDRGAGLELEEALRVKRARSRDGPEFG